MKSPLLLSLLLILPLAARAQEPLKVAVLKSGLGGPAVAQALGADPTIAASVIPALETDVLLSYDALYIGSATLDRPDQIRAIRVFVGCGGGLVLSHAACGRNQPKTMYPEIAVKVSGRREDTLVRVAESAHSLAEGLPAEFHHAYYDHLLLEPGPAGTVILRDRADEPVLVAGQAGAGRVVFNGMIPGYFYDPATFAQGARPPEGEELRLVSNALKWAGAARLSRRPPAEVAAERARLEEALDLAELRALLPNADWFGPEMLRGSYLPRRPVGELGGRFFITYDSQTWRGYKLRGKSDAESLAFFRARLRQDVLQLKWLGVTDIMWWTDVSGERVNHNTEVPDSDVRYPGFDPLGMLVEIADQEGMRVWVAWHSCIRNEQFAQKYGAKDAAGNLYKYGGRDYLEDLLSPVWRERCRALIDEYAQRYGNSRSFQGIGAYDELWFCYADFMGDDLAAFDAYCREHFGEPLPDDIGARLAQQRQWNDTEDVWRRRYILFKQWVMTDYNKFLIDYCHQKGLKFGLELLATAHYSSGWCWGMDSVALARLGADFLIAYPGTSAAAYYPNTYRWSHAHEGWGVYNTACFRESPGGIYFTFNQLWRPIMYGNNPTVTAEVARHIQNQREWAGAQSLARVALLHHQEALQMLLVDPRPQVAQEQALVGAVAAHQPIEVVFTRATELHDRYRVLIAPSYAVRGLSEDVMAALRAFVERGGTIIAVDADWTVARRDLTQERDLTPEVAGVKYAEPVTGAATSFTADGIQVSLGPQVPRRKTEVLPGATVLVNFADGTPAVTERALGEGRVIALHFNAGAALEAGGSRELAAWFSALVRAHSAPEVYAEGEGFRVTGALRKGDWVGVALFPDPAPCRATVYVDLPALGISRPGFRMLMLGKQMEIARPGDRWGEEGFWRPEELAAGFPVTIVDDHRRVLPLPESLDLSEFDDEEAKYIETVTRQNWDSVSEGQRKRTQSHEIVVLAPGDEPFLPQ